MYTIQIYKDKKLIDIICIRETGPSYSKHKTKYELIDPADTSKMCDSNLYYDRDENLCKLLKEAFKLLECENYKICGKVPHKY